MIQGTDKNGTYIIKNGKIEVIEPPKSGFGKQVIIWENDKPTRIEVVTSNIIK